MKFKSLQVNGFKSFADKLDIKFTSGITAIVGPNGCGKSNVADAIRWVLGEQSARLLRGGKMVDVIFSGTGKRKSLSFCEVSLTFDNNKDEKGKRLFETLAYKEVIISRRLYRSGESEYLLNKEACRLKDISELLREGNMGREGYSIVGQGRIDALLSAKPEERRAIFEEAAGIASHKVKKTEAERRLERTDENLKRISDNVAMKAQFLEPLTRQSQNARKYMGFKDQLKHHDINLYIYAYETASDAKKVVSLRLDDVNRQLFKKNKEAEEAALTYTNLINSIEASDSEIEGLRAELLEISVGLERDATDYKVLSERLSALTAQTAVLRGDIEKAVEQLGALMGQVSSGKAQLLTVRAALEKDKSTEKGIEKNYLAVVEKIVFIESEQDKLHSEILLATEKLADIKGNMGKLLAEKQSLEDKTKDLSHRMKFIIDNMKLSEKELNDCVKNISELTGKSEELENKLSSTAKQNNEALAIVSECSSRLDKFNAAYHSSFGRLKMLTEAQKSYDIFGESISRLLEDAKVNNALAVRIEGVVGRIMSVEKGFETAIEVALGNAVRNIIVSSETEAKFLIAYLKEKKYGRITFLPITSMKPNSVPGHLQPLLKESGVLCVATEAVKYDGKYSSVIKSLLGSTVIVKDMDAAISLAKKSFYGFKIVTLEGDIIVPSGAITGGSKSAVLKNIFGFANEIEALTIEVSNLEKDIAAHTTLKEAKSKEQAESLEKMSKLGELKHSMLVELAKKEEVRVLLLEKLKTENSNLDQLEGQLSFAKDRVAAIEKDIGSVSELEKVVASDKISKGATERSEKEGFDKLKKERDSLLEQKNNVAKIVAEREREIILLDGDIQHKNDTIHMLNERISENTNSIKANALSITQTEKALSVAQKGIKKENQKRVEEIKKRLAVLDDEKKARQERLSSLENRRSLLLTEIQEALEKKSVEEQQLLKIDTDIEYMQERVKEEYDLTYGACRQYKENGYNVEEGAQIAAKLKRQIQNLGHVNLDSIEQCKAAYEDYHAANLQKEDLIKAKIDIEKVIDTLRKEMIDIFSFEFEKIRYNFKHTFSELFNGGTADLLLQENEDMLEAGIDIVAQPPDKKLQTISLLSGGERALTAIAILFSILKLRPMPFCVLDEIEAALDDANAARFAKYLRRFAEDTQFIVITHRKPTMELADYLYGVTMEEKGVSKMVSVKLSEAVAVAEKSPSTA